METCCNLSKKIFEVSDFVLRKAPSSRTKYPESETNEGRVMAFEHQFNQSNPSYNKSYSIFYLFNMVLQQQSRGDRG